MASDIHLGKREVGTDAGEGHIRSDCNTTPNTLGSVTQCVLRDTRGKRRSRSNMFIHPILITPRSFLIEAKELLCIEAACGMCRE